MAHNTTRLGLNVVDGTDAVSAFPVADNQSKGVLDGAALFLTGLLANRPAAGTYGRWYLATDDTSSGSAIGTAWFDSGTSWTSGWNPPSRGVANIAASQATSSATYTTLATPDQVTGIVLPTNGMIAVWYQALWQESVAGAASAAIFVGANQLQAAQSDNAIAPQATSLGGGTHATGQNVFLTTSPFGLNGSTSNINPSSAPPGTGVAIAAPGGGGACYIDATAGTYTISVQFKASSGSVTVSNRKLRVQAVSFA